MSLEEKFSKFDKTQQVFYILYTNFIDGAPYCTLDTIESSIEVLSLKGIDETYLRGIITVSMSMGLIERRGRARAPGEYKLTEVGFYAYEKLGLKI